MCLATAALQHACCPSCSVAYFITGTSGIDKAPAEPSAQGPCESGERLCIQNTKIWCRFFWIGSCSSDRRQYCGSLLWDLGVISLILNHKRAPKYHVMGEGGPLVFCATVTHHALHVSLSLTSCKIMLGVKYPFSQTVSIDIVSEFLFLHSLYIYQ
jgi:hypothetical protein